MNKSGLIDAVRKTTSLPKRDAEDAVNAVVQVVSTEVRAGRRVIVSGFGSFNPTHRGARMGRNPRTGEPVHVPSSRSVRFAPSGTLKEILNGKATIAMPKSSPSATSAASGMARGTVGSAHALGHQVFTGFDHHGGLTALPGWFEQGRRTYIDQTVDACPGENSSTNTGQKGRRACPGEDSNEATGQEGR